MCFPVEWSREPCPLVARATADLHGNYIYKGDNPHAVEVLYAFYEMVSFDLTDNYWGTTDI